jgi:hypothetical protein
LADLAGMLAHTGRALPAGWLSNSRAARDRADDPFAWRQQ